jgi:hypothetical protein
MELFEGLLSHRSIRKNTGEKIDDNIVRSVYLPPLTLS